MRETQINIVKTSHSRTLFSIFTRSNNGDNYRSPLIGNRKKRHSCTGGPKIERKDFGIRIHINHGPVNLLETFPPPWQSNYNNIILCVSENAKLFSLDGQWLLGCSSKVLQQFKRRRVFPVLFYGRVFCFLLLLTKLRNYYAICMIRHTQKRARKCGKMIMIQHTE